LNTKRSRSCEIMIGKLSRKFTQKITEYSGILVAKKFKELKRQAVGIRMDIPRRKKVN
jgi:hypothetical protein